MAAKTWSVRANSGVDELLFQNDTVSLCLLVNRRHATLRVIDFRAGPTVAKRNFVIAAAKREGVEKVFTLVERDEVSTWTRLGFTREGSIPSFYKRSDAWILGAVVSTVQPMQGDPRMSLTSDDDDDDELEHEPPSASPAIALAERTLARAKRLVKNSPEKSLPRVAIAKASDADLKKAVASGAEEGRAPSPEVRAVRARRRAPRPRADRARRLRALRVVGDAALLRQLLPRAPRDAAHPSTPSASRRSPPVRMLEERLLAEGDRLDVHPRARPTTCRSPRSS